MTLPYRILALATLLSALAFGFYTLTQHYEAKGYDKAVAEYTAKALVAEQAARAVEQGYQQQLKKAQDDFQKRQTTLARDAGVARNAANGLRDTLTALSDNLPTITDSALADQARAGNLVLTQCVGEVEAMARDADDWHSEALRLRDSWPK